MSIFSKAKSIFLPDAETSRQRRINTFGTESKGVAATVIIGAAAAAIAAPAAIAAAGGRTAVLSGVGRYAAANPIKTAAIGLIGVPAITGSVVRDPTLVTKAPVELGQYSKDIYDLAKDPSIENAKELVKNSPILATATGAGIFGAGAGSAALAISNFLGDDSPSAGGSSSAESTPPLMSAAEGGPSAIPLTPQTQVMGRQVSSGTTRKRKPKKKEQPIRNTVRVQVLNQNTYIDDD